MIQEQSQQMEKLAHEATFSPRNAHVWSRRVVTSAYRKPHYRFNGNFQLSATMITTPTTFTAQYLRHCF